MQSEFTNAAIPNVLLPGFHAECPQRGTFADIHNAHNFVSKSAVCGVVFAHMRLSVEHVAATVTMI
jgi:hypothetical protein